MFSHACKLRKLFDCAIPKDFNIMIIFFAVLILYEAFACSLTPSRSLSVALTHTQTPFLPFDLIVLYLESTTLVFHVYQIVTIADKDGKSTLRLYHHHTRQYERMMIMQLNSNAQSSVISKTYLQ